ncbi:MAG: phosphodiester glycosidase family protein [Verrucomicrobiia bacterium]
MFRFVRWSAILVVSLFIAIAVLSLVRRFESGDAAVTLDTHQPGLVYTNQRVARVPWSIHVLSINRAQPDLGFFSAHARGRVLGTSGLTEQARSVPPEVGRAIAGVNGDFYVRRDSTYAGDPRGLQIVNGELTSAPDSVCVWFDADGNPQLDAVEAHFAATLPDGTKVRFGLNERRTPSRAVLYTPTYGPSTRAPGGRELVLENAGDGPWLPLQACRTYRARVREVSPAGDTRLSPEIMVLSLGPRLVPKLPVVNPGTVLEISTATTPDLASAKAAIAGGPALIQNGQVIDLGRLSSSDFEEYSERSKYERHPRSAIGWSRTHVYLVVVDGRQPRLSMGMKLAELAEYLLRLGCTDAMNLDGGNSAQMWLNGRIVNSPCHGLEPVANSLFVVRKNAGD